MMKDWFVGFVNLDTGKPGHATFTALTEGEARRSFKECYRHADYKIICCVAYKERTDAKE